MRSLSFTVIAAIVIVAAVIVRFAVLPRLPGAAMIAPSLTLASLDGPPFVVAAHRRQLVFVDFWATWCDPCRDSIPLVQRFRRAHPGVEVISVDVGEPPVLVKPFVARFGMRDVALDPDETAAHAFGVTGFPPETFTGTAHAADAVAAQADAESVG